MSSWSRAARAEAASRRRQRGAIGLFGILVLLLALVFTALAVDAGRLWFQRRQLQAVADLAALEAAKGLGCGGNAGDVLAAAQAAAERNGYAGQLGDAPNVVELGGLTTVAGLRTFQPAAVAEAVHVLATHTVPASLVLGGFFGQNTTLAAEATARAEPAHATFSAGSYLLRVSTTSEDANLLNGLLGGLLGSSLSLDAVSYQGLASADVSLADLVRAKAGVGSVEELLATEMTVAELIDLTATAVGQDAALAASLRQLGIAAAAESATVRLADVLDVSVPASEAAGKVGINVFDLINGTILLANKQHAVSLPLAVNLPGGLLNIGAQVNVIEPPQIAVGPPGRNAAGAWCAQARTAQIDVQASVHSTIPLVIGNVTVDLGLAATVAQGEAHLESLDVVPGATRAVIGATPGIASLRLTGSSGTGAATVTVRVLGIPITVPVSLDLPIQAADAGELVFDVASPVVDHLPVAQSIASPVGGSLATALGNPGAIEVGGGLGALLGPILNQLLAPLLGQIGSVLLDPLLKLLGIQLGGLDVTVEDIEYTGGSQLVI